MPILFREMPDEERAKRLICAIVAEEGGRFDGKTRLNKAFWWAHVYHYRKHAGLLSKYPIARLPEGPGADQLDGLLFELEREGRIKIRTEENGGYMETVCELLTTPESLDDDAVDSVRAAVKWVSGKSAAQVSRESHRLSRSWNMARDGDILDVAIDAISDEDFRETQPIIDRAKASLAWASDAVDEAFGTNRVRPPR